MRSFYTAVLYLLTPFALLRLLRRGFAEHGYWRRWPERFGFVAAPAQTGVIWVHAVSVGEVQAAAPLIRALCRRAPVMVTTTTPTGSRQVRRLFGDEVLHAYIPYDLPGAVRRFLRRMRPRLLVVLETELWPNLFHLCRRDAIPVVLVNARVSARSAAGYRRVRPLVRATLDCLAAIVPQSRVDAERLLELGADRGRMSVTGNLKFDVELPPSLLEQAQALRRILGVNRPVWIAASTHEGEEGRILDAFDEVRERFPETLLVIVPRHPGRFARVSALCRHRGHRTVLRTQGVVCPPGASVFVGDTMGELPAFYAASDVAFVGGSLVDAGGHNLLEPAATGVPVLTGPHLGNFTEVAGLLVRAGALRKVHDTAELARAVAELLGDAPLRRRMGECGQRLVDRNRGIVGRLLELLEPYLISRPPRSGRG